MSAAGSLARRAVWSAAVRLGLQVYEPGMENRTSLDRWTEYVEDARAVSDSRPTTATDDLPDLTLLPEALGEVLEVERFRGARILEVGPKYGVHARWLDRELAPSELVFSDFASDRHLHDEWAADIASSNHFVYGDLREAKALLELEPFDLVLFLGVLYHSIHHLELLRMLNRVTKPGGTMLLETTIDPRSDAILRIRWLPDVGKAKAVPSLNAVRVELAWTGWRNVRRFTGYRPGSSEELFLCEKTDDLAPDAELVDLVAPHRPPVDMPS